MGIVCLSPPTRPRRAPVRGPLARLQAGEIDLDAYLDLKVAEATAHLRRLPARHRDAIRAALLRELIQNPECAERVRAIAASVV